MISKLWWKLKLLFLRWKLRNSFYSKGEIITGSTGFIVEFIGPPGVGKTTYCDHLVKLLTKDYLVATGKQMKALLSTSYGSHTNYKQFHIAFFSDMLRHLSEFIEQLAQSITKTQFGLIELETDALSNSFRGIVINDEGLGHHFTNVFLDPSSSLKRSDIVDSYLDNRLIVFLNCSPETVLFRVKERFRKFSHIWAGHQGLTDTEVNKQTIKDIDVKKAFCNLIKDHNKSAVIVIDAENPISHNINVLVDTIRIACPSGLKR